MTNRFPNDLSFNSFRVFLSGFEATLSNLETDIRKAKICKTDHSDSNCSETLHLAFIRVVTAYERIRSFGDMRSLSFDQTEYYNDILAHRQHELQRLCEELKIYVHPKLAGRRLEGVREPIEYS